MSKGFKILLIVFAIVVVICGITYFSINLEDENTESTEKVEKIESKIPKGLSIENEDIEIEDGMANFSVSLINKAKKELYLKEVIVTLQDKKQVTISELTIPIDTTLAKGEEIELMAQDVANKDSKVAKTIYRFDTKKDVSNETETTENE